MLNLRDIKLPIESIPQTSWGLSLANKLEKEEWDKIRKVCLEEAHYKCRICGEENKELHCHEVWEFNDKNNTQVLKAVVCVCKLCHDCIHYFRSILVHKLGYITRLRNHIMKLNNWNFVQLSEYLEIIKKQNYKRVNRKYKVIVGNRELI